MNSLLCTISILLACTYMQPVVSNMICDATLGDIVSFSKDGDDTAQVVL